MDRRGDDLAALAEAAAVARARPWQLPADDVADDATAAMDVAGSAARRAIEADGTILFGRCIRHSAHAPVLLRALGRAFLIPAESTFLQSPVDYAGDLRGVRPERDFGVVVEDPPWENKSVRRARVYPMMAAHRLLDVPVAALTALGAVVAVWVTNKAAHMDYLRTRVLARWLAGGELWRSGCDSSPRPAGA